MRLGVGMGTSTRTNTVWYLPCPQTSGSSHSRAMPGPALPLRPPLHQDHGDGAQGSTHASPVPYRRAGASDSAMGDRHRHDWHPRGGGG